MRLGIVSDTHGTLKEEVLTRLQGCDAIIHAGDIGKEIILDKLREVAPLYVVQGNNDEDKEPWGPALPERIVITLDGVTMLIIHNRKKLKKDEDLSGIDLIIYGHSHQYSDTVENGIRYFNPGSCGRRRFKLPLSMAILTICEGNIEQVEHLEIL